MTSAILFSDMGKSSAKACGLLGLALATALGLGPGPATARAQVSGYLAKSGPAALRFQAVHPQNLSILPPLPKPEVKVPDRTSLAKSAVTSQPPLILVSNQSPAWTPPYANPPVTVPNPLASYSLLPPQNFGITNPAFPGSTANDLLNITPQMLVEYFRPVIGAPNSAGLSVFVPVQFTPATPAAPGPASSATYRTQ